MNRYRKLDISFIFITATLLISIFAIQYRFIIKKHNAVPEIKPEIKPEISALVEYEGSVEHIFFHSLIVYPEKAFRSVEASGFDDYYVTTTEFHSILHSLYDRGYILIDIRLVYETYTNEGKVMIRKRKLNLPPGKKPLIISFDDTNYYNKLLKSGINSRIVLTNGRIATLLLDEYNNPRLSYNSEHITLIEEFITEHPDFSFKGGRGVIGITGFEGILGYRTTRNYPQYASERENVKELISALRQLGWTFASHSFTHWHMEQVSLYKVAYDFERWNEEIRPLLGDLNVYLYPFGEGPLQDSNPRIKYYQDNQFQLLFTVGDSSWEKIYSNKNLVIAGRRQIDGIAFRYYTEAMRDLFDVEDVIDIAARQAFSGRYAHIQVNTNRLEDNTPALLSIASNSQADPFLN